jgi:hypothetical protein
MKTIEGAPLSDSLPAERGERENITIGRGPRFGAITF